MYYNVKPAATIVHEFIADKQDIPKGERSVFSIVAFNNNSFYTASAGFIGFPTARLEDEYNFFIYDDFVTSKKDFIPKNKIKHDIRDFIK